jgi:hypothetical protein
MLQDAGYLKCSFLTEQEHTLNPPSLKEVNLWN